MFSRTFLLVLVALIPTIVFSQISSKPGVVDATKIDFSKNRLNLNGSWIWYDNKLLTPSELENHQGYPIEFPGTWNERRASKSGQGYATYSLTIIVPHGSGHLALDMPDLYSSYILYLDDKEVARNGTPGKSYQSTTPQWRPQIVPITVDHDTVKLTLQVANFNHYKGGVKEPILIGSPEMFASKDIISFSGKTIAVGLLFVIALSFLVIYFRHGRKTIVVYFSMLCITWATRSFFSNDYIITRFFPDINWNLMVRIEYITLYLTMIWSILFLVALFRNEGNQVMKYLLIAFNCGFIIYTLVTQPVEFTRLLPLYLVVAGVLLIYGAGVVLVALINERKGAMFLAISVLLGVLTFSYDIFTYEGWFSYNTLVFSIAYVVMFMLTGSALLVHLGIIKSTSTTTTMLTYKDLYGDGN